MFQLGVFVEKIEEYDVVGIAAPASSVAISSVERMSSMFSESMSNVRLFITVKLLIKIKSKIFAFEFNFS